MPEYTTNSKKTGMSVTVETGDVETVRIDDQSITIEQNAAFLLHPAGAGAAKKTRSYRHTRQTITISDLNRMVHEALKTYNDVIGDVPLPDFDDSPHADRKNWTTEFLFRNHALLPISARIVHEAWFNQMEKEDWKLGQHKNARMKTHPGMVHWEDLDIAQRKKCGLLVAFFNLFKDMIEDEEMYLELESD